MASRSVTRKGWEDKFDREFAVQINPWGEDFVWADNADGMATKIKAFIQQTTDQSVSEALAKAPTKQGKKVIQLEWDEDNSETIVHKVNELVKSFNHLLKNK